MADSPQEWTAETGQDVTFTLERGYRAPMLRQGLSSLVVAGIAAFVATIIWPFWLLAGLTGLRAIICLVRYFWSMRFRTRLSADGVEARGYFNHFVPWSDITGIDAGGYTLPGWQKLKAPYMSDSGAVNPGYNTINPGFDAVLPGTASVRSARRPMSMSGYRARLATVKLSRSKGRKLLLRAPMVTAWQSDPGFDDKVRLIHKWLLTYGPPDQQRAAPEAG